MTTPANTAAVAPMSPTARSRISNGSRILEGIDGRSATARRFRDVLAQIVADLGGSDRLSEGQRQIARRCAMLAVECEKIEALGVAGEAIDLDTYGQLTDRIGRAFQRLGLKRVLKPIVSFDEHVARLAAARAANPPPPEEDEAPYVDEDAQPPAVVEPESAA